MPHGGWTKKRSGGGGGWGRKSTNMQIMINASITRLPTGMRGLTPRNYEVPFARPDVDELVMGMQFGG